MKLRTGQVEAGQTDRIRNLNAQSLPSPFLGSGQDGQGLEQEVASTVLSSACACSKHSACLSARRRACVLTCISHTHTCPYTHTHTHTTVDMEKRPAESESHDSPTTTSTSPSSSRLRGEKLYCDRSVVLITLEFSTGKALAIDSQKSEP